MGVGEDLGLHQTTVCKTFWNVCNKIVAKANEWIKFPNSLALLDMEKKMWQRKYAFPCVIGAIDCTHILIRRPNRFSDEFVNRKGLHSFNVQATVDSNEMFSSVECVWAGSVHDARVWRNSTIRQIMNENEAGVILLADEAYPLTPWVMTPFKNPVSDAQKSYNKLHKKERVIIERVFGQLKQRFPILQSKIRVTTERVSKIVIACCVLHNVAKFLNDIDDFELPEGNSIEIPVPPITQRETINATRGKRRRDVIANNIQGR